MKRILLPIFAVLSLALPVTLVAAVQYACPAGATNNGDGTCSIFLVASDDDTISMRVTEGGGDPFQGPKPESLETSLSKSPNEPLATTYTRLDLPILGAGNQFGLFNDTTSYVAYAEFNVASVPTGWTISSVNLLYQGGEPVGSELETELVGMTMRPSLVGDPELNLLFNDIQHSVTHYVTPWNPTTGTDQEVPLGATAVSDLRDSLANDWFAVGFGVATPGTDMTNLNSMYSLTSGEGDPEPTLEVVLLAQRLPELADTGVNALTWILGGGILLAGVAIWGVVLRQKYYV